MTLGVRSFMHPIDNLENRCERMLSLVHHFNGRDIRNPGDWQEQIYPQLREFLLQGAQQLERLRLVFDAHVSIAVGAGSILDVKSGKRIEIEQRTAGRRFWSLNDESTSSAWPELFFDAEPLGNSGRAIALAVGLTHDVSADVRAYIKDNLADVRTILHCRLQGSASQQSVRCGRHAWNLAEAIVRRLHKLRDGTSLWNRIDLFFAGPNACAFFLGQQQRGIGQVTVYEFDFERRHGGGYRPGLSLNE